MKKIIYIVIFSSLFSNFTIDPQKDTNEIFSGNLISEKLFGSIGTMKGTYKSSLKSNNWVSTLNGKAETKIEAELNYLLYSSFCHNKIDI